MSYGRDGDHPPLRARALVLPPSSYWTSICWSATSISSCSRCGDTERVLTRVARVLASVEPSDRSTANPLPRTHALGAASRWGRSADPLGGRMRCALLRRRDHRSLADRGGARAAYADWYRPAVGRFSGLGDASCAARAARLARRIDRVAPAGPVLDVGAGDGALLDALRAPRSRRARARARLRAPGRARGRHQRDRAASWAAIVFWHSLEHLPRARRRRSTPPPRCLRPAASLVVAVPNADSLQARVFGDRWFAPRPSAPPRPPPRRALLRGCASSGCEVERVSYLRGGQVVFGWLARPGRLAAGTPGPLRRDPPADARSDAAVGRRRAGTLAAGVALLPGARSRLRGRGRRSARRHRLRRGAPCLSGAGQGHRRDAGDERGARRSSGPSRRSRATASTK